MTDDGKGGVVRISILHPGSTSDAVDAPDYMKSSRKSSSRSWLLDSARLSSVMISS
jgi:hypothetical protein